MTKRKNASNADNIGDENDEKSSAIAVTTINSRKIRYAAGIIFH